MKSNNKIYSVAFLVIVSLILLNLFLHKSVSKSVNDTTSQIKQRAIQRDSSKIIAQKYEREPQDNKINTAAGSNNNVQYSEKYKAYLSAEAMGVIGSYNNKTIDNPADNIFTITIDRDLSINDKVELCYTLTGVEDNSNVTYSVNDHFALGGYLIKKSNSKTQQRVEINPLWLQKGENRILFSVPEGAKYGYKIENPMFEIKQSDDFPIAINTGSSTYNNQVYIQGFTRNKNTRVLLNGKEIDSREGIFETVVKNISNKNITLTALIDGKSYTKQILFNRDIKPDLAYAFIPSYNKIDKTFEKGRSDSLQIANARLNVGDSSLLANKSLSVRNLRTVDIAALDYGMVNVTAEGSGLRFLPHGEHFKQGTTVSIKYDRTKIPSGYTENDIKTYYFDNETKHWVALEKDSVNKQLCMVVSKTTHFTDMINGVIKTPESPETQGFTPTMMNDIKAADPTSGIQLISPQGANNSGSANLSYKIEVPPARNGMSPDLTIQYNSDGGSGWLGEGWDLNIPQIAIDTKFGVPTYNTKFETETYTLGGVMLARAFIGKDETGNMYDSVPEKMFIPDRGVVHTRNLGTDTIYQFYPRVEGGFNLITRYGNSTSNYKWRVEDKNGNKFYYGYNGTVLGKDTVVGGKNTLCKLAEWKLQSMVDIHKDSVAYIYTIDKDNEEGYTGDGIVLNPKAIYLTRIECYTYLGTPKNYIKNSEIKFVSSSIKSKKTNNARYGFLVSSQRLLDSVVIRYNNKNNVLEKVRSYVFKYRTGPLYSDLLQSINQLDSTGNEIISSQTFDYFNDIPKINNTQSYINQSSLDAIVNPDESIFTKYGGVFNKIPSHLISDKYKLIDKNGKLNNNTTTSINAGLYVGFGTGLKLLTKENTIGVNADYKFSRTKGQSMMIDINGDGLVDNVFKEDGKLYFCAKKSNNEFGEKQELIGAPEDFLKTDNNVFSMGLSLNGNISKVISGFAKLDYDFYNKSTTSNYFSDVNNDGLIDIIEKGHVYFNYLVDGIPHFSENSRLTANPITNKTIYDLTSTLTGLIRYDSAPDDTTKAKACPLQDLVRVWEAPYKGVVNISGNIKLLKPVGDYDTLEYKNADGIRVAIQKSKNELWSQKIVRDNDSPISTSVSTSVNQGDKIYFRLQSGDSLLSNGNFDAVIWNPMIQYVSTESSLSEIVDGNGYSNLKFIASEGNIVSKISYNELDTGVSVVIKGDFSKPVTKGNVKLQIFSSNYPSAYTDSIDSNNNPVCHNDYQYLPVGEIIYQAGIAYNKAPISLGSDWWNGLLVKYKQLGSKYKYFWFKLSSDVLIRWDSVKCYPTIQYSYVNKDNVFVSDTVHAGVKYDIHKKHLVYKSGNNYPPISRTCNLGYVSIKPIVLSSGNSVPISGEIQIKASDGFTYQHRFESLNESFDFYTGTTRNGCTFTFYLDNDDYKGHSLGVVVTDKNSPYSTQYILADNVYANEEDVDYGTKWRNWGQFEYNAAQGRYKKPIEEDSLFLPPDTSRIVFDDVPFVTLAPNIKNKRTWQGYSENIQLMGDTMLCGRFMDTEIDFTKFTSRNGGIRAPKKKDENSTISDADKKYVISALDIINKQTNLSSSFGVDVKLVNKVLPEKVKTKLKSLKLNLDTLSVGVNVDLAWGTNETLQDYKDFNGDGYPDYFADRKIKYSNSRGTITEIRSEKVTNENSKSNVFSVGVSLGNSTPLIKKSSSTSAPQKSSELAATIGASAGISKTNNYTNLAYLDVNGDGLPDMINFKDGTVCINYGYIFSPPVSLNTLNTTDETTLATNAGLGFGFEKGNGSWQAGVGIANAISTSKRKLIDINGDGLLDIVSLKESFLPKIDGCFRIIPREEIYVKLNLGNKFGSDSLLCSNAALQNNISTSYSANVAATFGFLLWGMRIAINPSVNASISYSRNLDDIQDYDGDGYADILTTDLLPNLADQSSSLKVRYSNIRRTNKLKTVTNPLGGSFTIDYERSAATTDHPGGKWVMKSVEVNDGIADDGPIMKNVFEYNKGKYDRREREFSGFGEVVTKNIDTEKADYATNPVAVRIATQIYDVSNYYVKGNLLQENVKDGAGNIFMRSENKYYTYNVRTKRVKKNDGTANGQTIDTYFYSDMTGKIPADTLVVYSPLKYSQNKIFEGNADSMATGQVYYKYCTDNAKGSVYAANEDIPYNYGDLKAYRSSDKGTLSQDGTGGFDYETTINYRHEMTKSYYVAGIPTEVFVKSSTGKQFRHVKAYYTQKNFPTHLTRITQFLNEDAGKDSASTKIAYDYAGNIIYKQLPSKMAYQYSYDPRYNMYLTQVKDTFGYSSSLANYNYKYGVPCTTTDINGNVMTTKIDALGRVVSIRDSKEITDNKPYTIAFEYNPKLTVGSRNPTPAYAVTKHYDPQHSGDPIETVTFVDGFGRAIQVKKEGFVEGTNQFIVSGRAKFDALGRAKEAYYPLTCSTDDKLKFISEFSSDAPPTKTVYDAIDRPITVTLPDGATTTTKSSISTLYGYEHKTMVTDALGNRQATFTDGSGKTTRTIQYMPDNSIISTKFEYDAINQLVKVIDTKGKQTLSEYDMAGRRTKVTHPASGETNFVYDISGNLIKKQTANLKATNQWITYDYDYNRLKAVHYPNHPENDVKYTYGDKDAATNLKARLLLQEDGSGAQEFKYGNMGELTEIRRTLVIPNQAVATYVTKWNYDSWNRVQSMIYPDNETVTYTYDLGGNLVTVKGASNYINNITYDKFEQRKSITYGNGTVTNYNYDNATRRLNNLKVQSGNASVMDNTYTYDKVGNVTQLVNNGTATNNIGGKITHNYGYDNLYRLISADGTFTGANGKTATYTLTVGYDNLNNIISKKQDISQTNLQFTGTLKAGYNLAYNYKEDNAQQITSIADENYRTETSDMPKEKNVHTYQYDANGNMKSVFTGTLANDTVLNAVNERKLLWDEENRLEAVSDNGYVNNYLYDAAGERTVKMHGGSEGVMVNGKQAAARLGAVDFTAYVSPYLVVSPGGNYTKHIYAGSQRISSILANKTFNDTTVSKAGDSIKKIIYTDKINLWQTALKAEYDSLGTKYGKVNSTFGGKGTNTGNLLYFYHPDHLGSSSLITDASGNVTQHIEYVPYGEVFIEEKNSTWSTPYKFNAKELDEETGLYYYGARYYDPKTSVWISVDPLAGHSLNVSSYVYCFANPVMYIDPDGRFSSKFSAQWHRFWHGGDEPILKNDKGQWYYRHISTQRESANSVSVSITDVYGKNGYHGKGGNHENSSSRKSSSSSGLSGYGMFGNARESLIDWGKPKHFYGYIDIAPLLYPVSNPSSKAETVYETAKKIDFFVDQTLKNGVAIEDIPKISNPDLEHPIEVEYNIDKWIQDPDDKNCKTSVMVKDTAYTQKQLDSIRNVAKKKLLPHTKIYENEAIIYK